MGIRHAVLLARYLVGGAPVAVGKSDRDRDGNARTGGNGRDSGCSGNPPADKGRGGLIRLGIGLHDHLRQAGLLVVEAIHDFSAIFLDPRTGIVPIGILHTGNQLLAGRHDGFIAAVGNLAVCGRTLLLNGDRDLRRTAFDRDRSTAVLARGVHPKPDRNCIITRCVAMIRRNSHPRRSNFLAVECVSTGLNNYGTPRPCRRERNAFGRRARGFVCKNRIVFRRVGSQLNVLAPVSAVIVRAARRKRPPRTKMPKYVS